MKRPCGTFDQTYAQDMSYIRTPFRMGLLAVLFLLLFIGFPLYADDYLLGIMNVIGITVVAMLGLNILTGYCGLISIGHVAFVGVGAYTSAILSNHLGWPFWATLPSAAVVTGLMGLLVGLPALRIKGFYIAISTLAFHYIIIWVILHGGNLTKGVWGLPCDSVELFGVSLDTERRMYYLIMVVAVTGTILAFNLVRTKYGRAFVAIRDNDIAAEFMGLNIFRYKVLAFVICSVYAGVAGCLYAHYLGMLTVEQFPLIDSIWYMGFLIVGGVGSITGAVFGAFVYRLIDQVVIFLGPFIGQVFPALSGSSVAGFTQMLFGMVIILFLVLEPRGVNHRWQIVLSSFRLWPFPY
ncbi:MAG: branched-chain amino acid ABC transporter permease [Deltaproteobacteria bacterium]|nr:branched-chain amino acid ABC transporter permease [Deltaproteobacteria bacterium]MBW1924487.1 branched-chain amino acid ABC transporter permease [Deltaproteobacteria bacterium]MBW1949684.1 branched-chain amino acid ABC transporter permease [Deltaproteobacteria bacterium]MBW2008752.1 branched-chain amino acid ABC transporter permease [Deltaproteobacteria bacterium]MBW2103223.1 branched-chain amino acid ABC transporter permease [Deltaproteobacteria bacterium]